MQKVAAFIALALSTNAFAQQDQLETIYVTEVEKSDTLVNTRVDRQSIFLRQVKDVRDLFANKMDVYGSQLQNTRSGGEGVNIRGLQGNRITSTIDGIPLPETQESKHFISYGSEFGRDDYIEVTGLRSADVQYAGSANSLSGSVNFVTLEPEDLLKGQQTGGFIGTGYNSVDRSVYGTVGGAIKVGDYQGMLMTTIRDGHETKNKGTNGSRGALRTEPNPADTRSYYVLTKHYYQMNPHHRIGAAFEYQRKKTDTNLLSLDMTNIDSGTGVQQYGHSSDKVDRTRFSLSHEYSNEHGWLQYAKTQVYYQDATFDNYRFRQGLRNYRREMTDTTHKVYGINSDFMTFIDGAVPQVLRYGFTYSHAKSSNHLIYERPAYRHPRLAGLGRAYFNGHPTADTSQDKLTVYFEDELSFGKFVVTPQIGFVHYRMKPKNAVSDIAQFQYAKQSETKFTPKISFEYRALPEFIPYIQYSRGVRTPSPQQLTSYFFESVSFFNPMTGRPQTVNVAVVGNAKLKSETADNFELGIKGEKAGLRYLVTGYYNRYHHFIDWVAKPTQGYASFIQYDNLDSAKVYGITADMKWNFYGNFHTNAGFAYARGRAKNNGVKTPINSIQPLKTRLGFSYEGEEFGANVQWTYSQAKADKDIEQSSAYLYNPTRRYSIFDVGMYWKPIKNLTITANVNNVFDKKYWNWNDISYLALISKATQDQGRPTASIPLAINAANADRFTAPGRNINIGLRYEF
ncbi:TonB-dependent receptor domain-containing protein [Pelistega ratti]|uniref:TonB-dependent receptor domain-containing protein n=1 Tax=Pelistega ratti TaxID=2652177 RepID=UPI00135CDCB9|nr:TonB-dependent receptor [Pelistega ratti]